MTTVLEINGQRVEVDDSFLSLSADQQQATVEEIAASLGGEQPRERRGQGLDQFNLGVADFAGGLVDLINPFDTPAVSQALGLGDRLTTGSAREGLVSAMQGINAVGEDVAPEGFVQGAMRGAGQAAGGIVPTAAGAGFLARAPGVTGAVADDVARGLSTGRGLVAEVAAGGASGGAMQSAEEAGLPDWAVSLAGVAAPIGLAGGVVGTQAAGRTINRVSPVTNAGRMMAGALAPYTRQGADAVARNRMQELAGGRDRAIELGERINPNDEFGLSPAQQTGDQNMLALEQAAATDPIIRERLDAQFRESMGLARGEIETGGNVADAQRFFSERRAAYTTEMRSVAEQAMRNAEQRLQGIQGSRVEGDNSLIVMQEIDTARGLAREREAELWQSIPRATEVPVARAREVAERLISETSRFQRSDIPVAVQQMLSDESGVGDVETFNDLHGLYSALRSEARNARAGENTNPNLARMADQVADAILEDLSGENAPAAIASAMNEARAFSVALHQTFDQGAIGRLSRRRIAGDDATDPELALERTVGRPGTTGAVSARNLEGAAAGLAPDGTPAPQNETATAAIQDFISSRFSERTFSPNADGQMVLNRRGAASFIRDNAELLDRYPELRQEILGAVEQQQTADQLASTIANRIGALEDARRSVTARFIDAPTETAVRSIIDSENPVRAAQTLVNAARRDETGAALDGIQAAFSDDLISRALRTQDGETFLEADAILSRMREPRFRAAMSRVYSGPEIRRLERIVGVIERLNRSQTRQPALEGQTLSGAQAPVALQFMARIVGAQAANRSPIANGGGAGVSLQAAQLGSSAAQRMLGNLTADRASRILADAVTDPRLMQSLLMDPASPRFEREALPRLLPYLVGGSTAVVVEED